MRYCCKGRRDENTRQEILKNSEAPKTKVNDYAGRAEFRPSRESVFEAIATTEGIRGWWTPMVKVLGATGKNLRLELGELGVGSI